MLKKALFTAAQLTWGLPQTLAGAAVAFAYRHRPRFRFHGAVVTQWPRRQGLSLGLFLFVSEPVDERLLVHEYGHSVQSLVLGPLYLVAVGLPSVVWAQLPACARWRGKHGVSYYAFLPERTASALGTRVLGLPAAR